VALWKQETETIKRVRGGEVFEKIKDASERAEAAIAWQEALAQWERGLKFGPEISREEARFIRNGEALYFQTCVSCHGADGKGTTVPGGEMALAPPLAGSRRVTGPIENLMPVLVNGLVGPIEGKSYQAGYMPPAHALGVVRDDRLAELVSYIRYAWGNGAGGVSKDEVKEWRKKLSARTTPWTEGELLERKAE
jgi:mono/diheme cytochrome c family protein